MDSPVASVADEELLKSFLGGNDSAFETLVQRYEKSLRRVAFGLVRDRALAEDIAQESFFRAYRSARSFRFGKEGGSFRSWLYRIAINRAHDELRRRRRKPEHALPEEAPIEAAASAEAEAARHELGRHLAAALAELRPEYRAALVLKEVEGMTYAEIAETLGWPLGTVQVRIHRARLELRAKLGHGMKK